MRVAVLGNLKQNAPATADDPDDAWAELDTPQTTDAIVAALTRAGHEAAFFEGDLRLVQALPAWGPDLCFNLCEGHHGDAREAQVPAVLELLRVPYTGAAVTALALTLDKPLTKRVLASHGVPTPPFQVFGSAADPLSPGLRFPLHAKPAHEGSGKGVLAESRVADEASLRRVVAACIAAYRQPALVEPFVRGRELTVGLVGNLGDRWVPTGPWAGIERVDGLFVLPPYECVLPDDVSYSGALKTGWTGDWGEGTHYRCPAPLDFAIAAEVVQVAVDTFRATGCRDIARVDLRLDADARHRPTVLEINALPGLAPGWSDLTFEAAAAGLTYDDLILGILDAAIRRMG